MLQSVFDDTFLVCLGFVCMAGSIGYFFIGGAIARYGFLILGFLLVALAALKRGWAILGRHVVFYTVSTILFGVLLLIGLVREHETMHATGVIFQCVAFALFVCGYVFGMRPRVDPVRFDLVQAIAIAGVSIAGLVAILRFTEQLAFYQVGRGFGETELNPVGLAYATSVVLMISLVVVFDSRTLFSRLLAGKAAVLAVVVVLVSGSRGATLYAGASAGFLVILLLYKRQLRLKAVAQLAVVCAILLIGGAVLSQRDFAFFDRFEVFTSRWEQMIRYFTEGDVDSSISARGVMQRAYLSNPSSWILVGAPRYEPYPHNQFIEWAGRFGVLGMGLAALFTWCSAFFLWKLVRNRLKAGGEQMLVMSLLLFSVLQSMTSLSLEINRSMFFCYGYCLAFFIQHRGAASVPVRQIGRASSTAAQ